MTHFIRTSALCSVLCLLLAAGCGGGDDKKTGANGSSDNGGGKTNGSSNGENGTNAATNGSGTGSNGTKTNGSDSTDPANVTPAAKEPTVVKSMFGKTKNDEDVVLFECTNANGLVMRVINYGATVIAVETPDRDGKLANITQGFSSIDGYLQRHPYFGSTVGRFCNRIAGGKFTIDDQEYTLATNNGPNHLHGGEVGFDQVLWEANEVISDDGVGVSLSYTSPDGEEGYPGNLEVMATYTLNNKNELKMEFMARTDAPTPVNLTNHCYWNLAGAGNGTILDHELQVLADEYLPVDETAIPTGELATVESTPFDFRSSKKIGDDFDNVEGGYDHCFVLTSQDGSLAKAAIVKDAKSGRVMEIHTTQPGLQFYTGNFLDGSEGNGGFKKNQALCLETQHYPDSPNQPSFPTTILKPDEVYKQTTVHKFSVE